MKLSLSIKVSIIAPRSLYVDFSWSSWSEAENLSAIVKPIFEYYEPTNGPAKPSEDLISTQIAQDKATQPVKSSLLQSCGPETKQQERTRTQ